MYTKAIMPVDQNSFHIFSVLLTGKLQLKDLWGGVDSPRYRGWRHWGFIDEGPGSLKQKSMLTKKISTALWLPAYRKGWGGQGKSQSLPIPLPGPSRLKSMRTQSGLWEGLTPQS
jgi:hypothetical protein